MVLGNCQVGGLAESLRLLIPGVEVKRKMVSNDLVELESKLIKYGKSGNQRLLLHDSVQSMIDDHPQLQGILPDDTITVPTITFAAFHPDIQYAFTSGNVVKSGLNSEWNSRILLWAYMNELNQQEARELFREDVYQELGYMDEWTSSSELLIEGFKKCGLDFGRWMRSMQRYGVFMYGINHPLPVALSNLAVQIIEQNFADKYQHIDDSHEHVADYLAHTVWPVYPEIAEVLGIDGTYTWQVGRLARRKRSQLDEFISLCYKNWDAIDLRKLSLNLVPAISEKDNGVLLQMSGIN
jgi:hypothetical protein